MKERFTRRRVCLVIQKRHRAWCGVLAPPPSIPAGLGFSSELNPQHPSSHLAHHVSVPLSRLPRSPCS